MKTIFAAISFLLILLFAGCQESLVNQPIPSLNKENPVIKDEINICCPVDDFENGVCQVVGKVTYIHEKVESAPGISYSYTLKLSIIMDSELCNRSMSCIKCNIKGSSFNTLQMTQGEVQILQKKYSIGNRSDIVLVVVFMVKDRGVEITKMWLQKTKPMAIDEK